MGPLQDIKHKHQQLPAYSFEGDSIEPEHKSNVQQQQAIHKLGKLPEIGPDGIHKTHGPFVEEKLADLPVNPFHHKHKEIKSQNQEEVDWA